MFRKLSILALVLVLVSGVVSAAGTPNPDADDNGCFVDDTVTVVNEGVAIPVTIKCVGVPTDNNVFGFQFGTSVTTGSFTGTTPTGYGAGTFTSAATGGAAGVLVGENSLGLYGVSRRLANVVGTTDFTLGTLALTAVTNRGTGAGLTDADGSVVVTFDDAAFKLSDNFGLDLGGWLRTVNDATTNVNDIDLAWLSGDATVKSDSNAIANIKTVVLDLGAKQYTAANVASSTTNLTMDNTFVYVEDAAGVVGGSFAVAQNSDNVLDITVDADMWGHLACSTGIVNLGDVGAAKAVTAVTGMGTTGVFTLKAGDVNMDGTISNTDATSIGLDFGDAGVAINGSTENDINIDNTVDILDLVHVGRNFNAATTTCS